jgi:transposase, IS30 family
LVALPGGDKPEQVAPALAAKIRTLPVSVRRWLTCDQGPEMRDWKQILVDAGIEISFCDPHAPWQRGSNENTNGLLRQYFPKGTELSQISEFELDRVADELNDRPRKRLGFYKPSERIAELLDLHTPPGSSQRSVSPASGVGGCLCEGVARRPRTDGGIEHWM